jgi:hypothetical protein
VTDLEALLAERRKDRADKDTEFALLDCLQDDDGFVEATFLAVVWMACEKCAVLDSQEPMHKGLDGRWWPDSFVARMNHDEGVRLFSPDDADWEIRYDATLCFYRTDRWRLVCPACKRSLAAAKANATRKARADAARAAEPNLFSGAE